MRLISSTTRSYARLSSTLAKYIDKTAGFYDSDKLVKAPNVHGKKNEESKDDEFKDLIIEAPKRKLQVERMTGRAEDSERSQRDILDRMTVRAPRREEMSEDQDQRKVWPAAASSSTSAAMLPTYANFHRKPENRPPFKTFGNSELLKIPNFLHKAPRTVQRRMEGLRRSYMRQQFADALRNGTEAEAKLLLDKFLESEQLINADLFLEELIRHKLKKLDYGNASTTWSNYANIERTIAGADQLLKYVLSNKKEVISVQQSRIKRICETIERIFTSSVAFAECVSAYLIAGKFDEAKVLATYYVISPRSFIDPMRRLAEKGDLQSIEKFAQLFTEIYFDKIHNVSAPRKVAVEQPENSESKNDDEKVEDEATEQELIAKNNVNFLLQSQVRKKKFKYMAKKPKVRKYEVDHRQLDILVNALIESWIDVADTKNNVKSLDNMHYFIQQNKVFIRRGHLKVLKQILERNGIEENPFEAHVQKF